VGVRTQITLTEQQYTRLKRESERTGASLAELIRVAVDSRYGLSPAEKLEALERSHGSWPDAPDGAAYVESLRPGLDRRLRDLGL
jgi:hypothetical protein